MPIQRRYDKSFSWCIADEHNMTRSRVATERYLFDDQMAPWFLFGGGSLHTDAPSRTARCYPPLQLTFCFIWRKTRTSRLLERGQTSLNNASTSFSTVTRCFPSNHPVASKSSSSVVACGQPVSMCTINPSAAQRWPCVLDDVTQRVHKGADKHRYDVVRKFGCAHYASSLCRYFL